VRQHTRFIVDPHLSPTVKDRGHIFIEFVLVAPVILFISLYSLCLVQVLQAQQIATTLSREIATEVYRNCVDLTVLDMASTSTAAVDAAKTQAAIQSCLISTKNKYASLMPTHSNPPAHGSLPLILMYIATILEVSLLTTHAPALLKTPRTSTAPRSP
jgi:hypothetical protein